MSEIAILVKNVSKSFKRYAHPVDRLKEILLPRKTRADEFWALQDINLEVLKGQTLGLIGRNGCGKSTLLQIIAGTLTPTRGEVRVNGRISALLELGSGFNPEFTGQQNVFFNGRLLGLTQKEIEDKFEEIASFADIGDFITQPVKTYSSGMFVRLAFAVAVNVSPEVLIVDEALAVGDVVFQHRCMRRMRTLMDSGVTTLFVSHDSGAIKTLCNSAIMLHEGKIYTSGLPNKVIIEYMKLATELEIGLAQVETEPQVEQANQVETEPQVKQVNQVETEPQVEQANQVETEPQVEQANQVETEPQVEQVNQVETEPQVEQVNQIETEEPINQFDSSLKLNNNGHQKQQDNIDVNSTRRGNRKALIKEIKLLNEFGEYTSQPPIFKFNEQVTLIVELKVFKPLQECIIGFFICDKNGNEIIGSNTLEENISIGKLDPKDRVKIEFKFRLPLKTGSYCLTVASAENSQTVTFDWIDNAIVFQILPPDTGKIIYALIDHPMEVSVSRMKFSNRVLSVIGTNQ